MQCGGENSNISSISSVWDLVCLRMNKEEGRTSFYLISPSIYLSQCHHHQRQPFISRRMTQHTNRHYLAQILYVFFGNGRGPPKGLVKRGGRGGGMLQHIDLSMCFPFSELRGHVSCRFIRPPLWSSLPIKALEGVEEGGCAFPIY